MSERLRRYVRDLERKPAEWMTKLGTPYSLAYNMAYTNYTNTLKKQSDADRARAEALAALFVFSASILTGSIAMAAFATTSVKSLAGRALLHTICNNNLNRAFNVMYNVNKSKALVFALGEIVDAAGKQVPKQVESYLKKSMYDATGTGSASDPLSIAQTVRDFFEQNYVHAHQVATKALDDRSLSDGQRDRVAAVLEAATFYNPPAQLVIKDRTALAERIELGFYLNDILNSDSFVKSTSYPGGGMGYGGSEVVHERKSIETSPSSPSYPRNSTKVHSIPTYVESERVAYRAFGSDIRDRVNELHRKILGSNIFEGQGIDGFLSYRGTKDHVIAAERGINSLARKMLPAPGVDFRIS